MSVERLKIMSLNPFLASKLIQSFMTGYNGTIELKTVFYVLPIIMYKESREKLVRANSNSRINTLFGSRQEYADSDFKVSGKITLTDFIERFDTFSELTKQAIIVLSEENKIRFGNRIELVKKLDYRDYPPNIRVFLKAAFYLGKVMSKSSLEYFENFVGVHSA